MRTTTRQDSRLDLADAWLAVLLVLILLLSGCATRAVWNEVPERDGDSIDSIDWSDGKTITAVAITPVALALDVGVMWAVMAALACTGASTMPLDFDFDPPEPRDDMARWHASKMR
jgi:hypothetical protein